MTDLVVIYDPLLEMAAVVDIDARRSWGPAMIGSESKSILEAWIEGMPFDAGLLDSTTAATVFADWLQVVVAATQTTPATAPPGALEPPDDPGVDPAALAEHEASAAGAEPPAPQPADTDPQANPDPPPQVVTCPLCTGAGVTSDGADGASTTCAMCGGAKVVRMAVPS
jgi:hypothetical protein